LIRSHYSNGDIWYETTPADKWKFTGYERDSGTGETGLDYANFRYYASAPGRFVSADLIPGHIGLPQSFNRYNYTRNDPVNMVDPLGLDVFQTCTTTGMFFVEFFDGSETSGVNNLVTVCTLIDTGGGGFGGGGGSDGGGGGGGGGGGAEATLRIKRSKTVRKALNSPTPIQMPLTALTTYGM
jgi:RHS repeat-associated protein